MADLELAKFIHSFTEAWMTIFLILGGHLSMSRTWTHPLFCSFSDSSASIRNMPWMHFFDASSNREHNIQILHHATQSLSIPGISQHPNLTRCLSSTVHIIHQVNLVSQFLKKKILCSSVSWKNSSYFMGIRSTPAIHFDLPSHILLPLCTYLFLIQPAPLV